MVGPPCPRFRQVFVVILGFWDIMVILGHLGISHKKIEEPPPQKKTERTWQFFSVFFSTARYGHRMF